MLFFAIISWQDAAAVNWDASLYAVETNSFSSANLYTSGGQSVTENHTRNPATASQGGLGWYVNIHVYDWGVYAHPKNIASLTLIPKNPMYKGGTASNINYNYVHNTNPLGATNLSFSYSGLGVSIDPATFSDKTSAYAVLKP